MRGKKTPTGTVYAIMTSWAVTNSYTETAKELGLSYGTVQGIVEKNKNKPEFVKLRTEKADEFAENATRIINKALKRLEREIDNEELFIPVNQLTTAIGTLYDKRALAQGQATEKIEIISNATLDKLAELAGYEKR